MDEKTLLETHETYLEELKTRLINNFVTRTSPENTYKACAANIPIDMLSQYETYCREKFTSDMCNANYWTDKSWTEKVPQPASVSIEVAPFVYDVYAAGSDSPRLSRIAKKHSAELQVLDASSGENRCAMMTSMLALVQALAEKEGKKPKDVYQNLDKAFSRRNLGKDADDAFKRAGCFLGEEKFPRKTRQDIVDILYTQPSVASREDKIKALKVCARRYSLDPAKNEEYLVILADCRQDVRKIIKTPMSNDCYKTLQEISPDLAEELKEGGYVGNHRAECRLYVPNSRYDAKGIEEVKEYIENASQGIEALSEWRDKLMAVGPTSSNAELQDFQDAAKALGHTQDKQVAETVEVSSQIVAAFARKSFTSLGLLSEKMKERTHTSEYHNRGPMMIGDYYDHWREDTVFYNTIFARDAIAYGDEFLRGVKSIEADRLAAEEEAKRQAEADFAAKEKETEAARRKRALDAIGAFRENLDATEENSFEPISVG